MAKNPPANARDISRCGFDPWVGKIPWRTWQPTPVFLPGESHGQRSLVGYTLWGCKGLCTHARAHTCAHTHTHLLSISMPSLFFLKYSTHTHTHTHTLAFHKHAFLIFFKVLQKPKEDKYEVQRVVHAHIHTHTHTHIHTHTHLLSISMPSLFFFEVLQKPKEDKYEDLCKTLRINNLNNFQN